MHQANPDFSKDAAAYLDFLVGMGTLRLLLLAQSALNFEATYCTPPPEALAANNLQSLSVRILLDIARYYFGCMRQKVMQAPRLNPPDLGQTWLVYT